VNAQRRGERVSAGWAGAVVVAVVLETLLFGADPRAMAGLGVLVLVLAAGWYAHMRVLDRDFRVEVCLRPLGRVRF
jgi:hypothetical protein